MMKSFTNKICYGGGYISPSLRQIDLAHKSVFCASNGSTENYGSQNIWEDFDDNE
jgi:hypothetical protein